MSEITRNEAIQIVEDIRTAISAGSVTNTMEALVLDYCVKVLGGRIEEASQSGSIVNLPDVVAFLAGISSSTTLRELLSDITGKIPSEASSLNQLADKAFVTSLSTALQTAVNTINSAIGNGYVYAGIATLSVTPVSGKVFYLARQGGQYTNFGGLTVTEGINILKRNGSAWSQEQLMSMADIYKNPLIGYYECDTAGNTAAKTVTAAGYVLPTTGGSMKIKMANRNTAANATLNINSTGAKPLYYNGQRAGVGNTWGTNEVIEVFYDGTNYQAYNVAGSNGDGVFDISVYNLTNGQPTPYADLADALGTDGANIPLSLRKGGMSVKFIQGNALNSDNKYVQYRLMASSWSTTVSDWQGVDDEPTAGSENLVKSGGVFNHLTRMSVDGDGENAIVLHFELIKGRTYRVDFDNPSWARDNTGTIETQYIFGIVSYSNSTGTILVLVNRSHDSGTLNKSYTFTVPDDSDEIRFILRANDGEKILFSLNEVNNKEFVDFACGGDIPYDEFMSISSKMIHGYVINSQSPVNDPLNIEYLGSRLLSAPFSFSENKIIKCDRGYKFKLVELDSSNIIVEWPDDWNTYSSPATIEANKSYIVSMANAINSDLFIDLSEHIHIYIDDLKQRFVESERNSTDLVNIVSSTGKNPYDEFLPISSKMEKLAFHYTKPITEDAAWTPSPVRLSTRESFTFTENKIIRCDTNYYFKVAEVNPETNMVVAWPEVWSTKAILNSNTPYIISVKKEIGGIGQYINVSEHVHIYIDTIRQTVENNMFGIDNVNTSYNFLGQYYKDVDKKYISDSSKSVYSDDAWSNIGTRIALYKKIITAPTYLLIEVDSGYNMGIMKVDSQTGIPLSSAVWNKFNYIAEPGESFIFYLQHTDNTVPMYESDVVHIHSRELEHDFYTMLKASSYHNPMDALYTKFIRSSIMEVKNDQEQLIGKLWFGFAIPTTRCTAIFTLDKSITISMRNPAYVFRLYWYETVNNEFVLHTTDWGSLWEVPANTEVGLTIKPRTGTFADDERPELYLEEYKVENEPKDYYKAEIEDTVNKVNAAFTEPGLCFLLSTDQHYMSVQGTLLKYDTISDMVVNMRAVAKRIKVDAHISLGDIADFKVGTAENFANLGIIIDDNNIDYQYLDEVFHKWMTDAMVKLKAVHPNFLYLIGNHDDNRYINKDKIHAAESEYDYTKGEMFSYYVGKGEHNLVYNNSNNGLDYYVDYENFKIRMICLDSNCFFDTPDPSSHAPYGKMWWYGFSDETLNWLIQQLGHYENGIWVSGLVPNDYSVILLTHMSSVKEHNTVSVTDSYPYNYKNMDNIRNAIQNYITNGGKFIATLYGHSHLDLSFTTPWLDIAFGCQKCVNGSGKIPDPQGGEGTIVTAPIRTAGTYTEDLWSVVCILPQSRKIKIIRFGAGDDREFTY